MALREFVSNIKLVVPKKIKNITPCSQGLFFMEKKHAIQKGTIMFNQHPV